jgi:hypothetical protein
MTRAPELRVSVANAYNDLDRVVLVLDASLRTERASARGMARAVTLQLPPTTWLPPFAPKDAIERRHRTQ